MTTHEENIEPCPIYGCTHEPSIRLTENGDQVRCDRHTLWISKNLWNTRPSVKGHDWIDNATEEIRELALKADAERYILTSDEIEGTIRKHAPNVSELRNEANEYAQLLGIRNGEIFQLNAKITRLEGALREIQKRCHPHKYLNSPMAIFNITQAALSESGEGGK